MRLTRVRETLGAASVDLWFKDWVEIDIEADCTALLAILQDRRLNIFLRSIRFEYAEVERGKAKVCVRTVVVVIEHLEEEVLS